MVFDLGVKDHLNPIIRFFQVAHIYTKTELCENVGRGYTGSTPIFSIYEAKEEAEYEPRIIIDNKNMINPREEQFSLIFADSEKKISDFLVGVPPSVKAQLEEILSKNGYYIPPPKEREGWNLSDALFKSKLCLFPTHKLRDVEYALTVDWPFFVELLLRWESEEKDKRLNIVHKCQLLKGIEPRANTHSIICTNGGTGKSIHFKTHGINIDKATKNTFLGFAKSPKEIFKGTIDGSELPIGIDQLEVGNWGVMDFMFNVMESGEGRVQSGAVDFTIRSKSPIALIANPLGEGIDPETNFSNLLSHITNNPAIGRRIGIFVYGQYDVIKTNSTTESLNAWKDCSTFFRAVEEYVKPELEKLYANPKLWDWLNIPIDGYYNQIYEIVGDQQDRVIKTLFLTHAESGQRRVKASAFNGSVVDHLQEILKGDYTIESIIQHAEETILPELITINLESMNNIVRSIVDENKLLLDAYINTQPDYMKEIIYAVEYARRSQIIEKVFMLSSIDYKPRISSNDYLSQCIEKLLRRKKGISEFNSNTTRFFGFSFEPFGTGDLKITLIKKEPFTDIHLPDLPDLPESEISKNQNTFSHNQVERVKREKIILKPDSDQPDKDFVKFKDFKDMTTQEKMNTILKFMSPRIGYDSRSLSEYFDMTLSECDSYLRSLENTGELYNKFGKWYLVTKEVQK